MKDQDQIARENEGYSEDDEYFPVPWWGYGALVVIIAMFSWLIAAVYG
jgi:hypothetical protein